MRYRLVILICMFSIINGTENHCWLRSLPLCSVNNHFRFSAAIKSLQLVGDPVPARSSNQVGIALAVSVRQISYPPYCLFRIFYVFIHFIQNYIIALMRR
jgi:hypothetical protein